MQSFFMQMRMLIWIFVERACQKVRFLMLRLIRKKDPETENIPNAKFFEPVYVQ